MKNPMKTASIMLSKSKNSLFNSQKAFEAEWSEEAFYDANMHLKMARTVFIHIYRCIRNLGFAFFCIGNTAYLACTDKKPADALDKGSLAIGNFFIAAAVDFANIFVTLTALVVRTFNSLHDGYLKNRKTNGDIIDRVISKIENIEDKAAHNLQYTAASNLNLTSPS